MAATLEGALGTVAVIGLVRIEVINWLKAHVVRDAPPTAEREIEFTLFPTADPLIAEANIWI